MERREKRKQVKAKAREREIRAKQIAKERATIQQRKRDEYPRIIFQGSGRDERFIVAVKAAITQIDLSDDKQFSPMERAFYKLVRSDGARVAAEVHNAALDRVSESDGQAATISADLQLNLNLGERIFQRIPESLRRTSLPFSNCQILPTGNEVLVQYRELRSRSGTNGTIYHSEFEPEVCFEGTSYKVAFSRHAIERICERMKPEHTSYGSLGDLFGFFAHSIYFEPVVLYPDQPGFLMFDWAIMPGVMQYESYVKGIFGEENIDWNGGLPYYRLGYCPVVFEQGFAKAKSFLTPGFRATPESGVLRLDRSLSNDERTRLIHLSENTTTLEMLMQNGFDHIKWFHHNGVPQVVQMDREVFRYNSRPLQYRITAFPWLNRRRLELQNPPDDAAMVAVNARRRLLLRNDPNE